MRPVLTALAAAALTCAIASVSSAAYAAEAQAGSAASAPAAAAAVAQRPLTAETMWKLQRLGDPKLSPDGRWAVLSVTKYDVEENKGSTDLWLVPTAGGAARQLTSDEAPDTSPAFSPDGRWIAFVSKRADDKQAQVYVIPTDGGEARRLTNMPTGAEAPKWFPDSKRVAFISRVFPGIPDLDAQKEKMKAVADAKMSAKVWTSAPITHWDRFLDEREAHLWIASLDGGTPASPTYGTGRALPQREAGAGSYDVAPDGREIAFVSNTDTTGEKGNLDLFVVSLEPGANGERAMPRNLTPANEAGDTDPAYSPDGRWLAFEQKRIRGFYADRSRLMLLDRSAGTVRSLTEDWDRSANGLVWLPDSSGLLGSIDDAATTRVYEFRLKAGTPRPVTKSNDYTSLDVAGRTVVALRQSFSEPPTLVRVDARTGNATKLSTFNDGVLAGVAFGKVESVTYKGANGADIQMWVIKPPGVDPAKKYPLFLILHGGPHNGITDTWQWRWNAHVFAGWGYVAAWHNFHGSSGFGNAFADSINPDWATLPYEDTIKAADWFAQQPWIDSGRMIAGGGSYGGYLASVLLGRPHPFRALIAHAAVYNSYTQVGSDFGAEKARFWEYWENPEAFQKRSPHMAAANFRTPTLVIHGQLDYRVPVNHGIELFNTLQNRGVESKLVYFPDENHWVLKPQNSLFWYATVKDWVEHYAKPAELPQFATTDAARAAD